MDQNPSGNIAYVIEDEYYLAAIYSRALDKAGFQPESYYNGREALEHLRQAEQTPTLVILDLNLPQVSGNEILRFIRDDTRLSNTRVILATSEPVDVASELERKADLVLQKPISYIQLRDLASRFL